ncbi:MAG: pirin family protein [Flavobacterium sp.]|nr:MAG: pirin family protein [Flavobacterium sp.]
MTNTKTTQTIEQQPVKHSFRSIAFRNRGNKHGFITRLMSPGDLGQLVKPFVFLDYFESPSFHGQGMNVHPHSGIATHTTLLEGTIDYEDSTGKSGTLHPGSVEWMQAGNAVWHGGTPHQGQSIRGYQLWVALPEELELAPAKSQYFDNNILESDGNVRILLGTYGKLRSSIDLPVSITYLHVKLNDGDKWIYQPDSRHDVAWVAVNQGKLHVSDSVLQKEMVVFSEGNQEIEFQAEGSVEFVIGSSEKHPHPLVMGYYSVHTNEENLIKGEAAIEKLGRTPEVIVMRNK